MERNLVDDDDRVFLAECFKECSPVTADVPQRRELCGGGIDELFELVLCRGLDRLIVDSVVPISDGLANELTLTEATAAVDHDEIPRLGLIAVRELIEFDVSINEVLYTASRISDQVEFSISEITISKRVISFYRGRSQSRKIHSSHYREREGHCLSLSSERIPAFTPGVNRVTQLHNTLLGGRPDIPR